MRSLGASVAALALGLAASSAAWAGDPPKKKTKVAVLEVKCGGAADPKAFEGLSSIIAAELSRLRPDVVVVGASDIRTLLGFEKEKQLLGCSDGACLAEIGGALGVDYLVTTEGTKIGKTWALTMASLDSAKAVATTRVVRQTEDDNKLLDLTRSAVREIAASLPGAEQFPELSQPAAPELAAEVVEGSGRAFSPALSWGLVAAGVVVAGAGGGCLGYSYAVHSDYRTKTGNGSVTPSEARSMASTGNALSATGVTALSVGAAVLVAGVVTFFIPGGDVQAAIVPTRGGAQAAIAFRLP